MPLFASAHVASAIAGRLTSRIPECVCISAVSVVPAGGALAVAPAQAGATASTVGPIAPRTRTLEVRTGTVAQCRVRTEQGRGTFAFGMDALHWLSAGATSFARGLNDTPKIVAIGAFALLPAGMPLGAVLAVVSIAMAAGGLAAATRVGRRLGDDVVPIGATSGATANAVTAALIGAGALQGLPMSLTHVASGSIAGTAGTRPSRLNARTLRGFALAWTVTPAVAGLVAAGVFVLAR